MRRTSPKAGATVVLVCLIAEVGGLVGLTSLSRSVSFTPSEQRAATKDWGLQRTHRFGTAIADREAGYIDYASWLDDDTIVYWSAAGTVTCRSIDADEVLWSLDGIHDVFDWSVSRKARRLAILSRSHSDPWGFPKLIHVIEGEDGNIVFSSDSDQLPGLLGVAVALPTRLAFTPNDARLIVCTFAEFFGRNGFVLHSDFTGVEATFDIDPSPSELSNSPDGSRLAFLADANVLCVRDIKANKDIYFRGTRITERLDVYPHPDVPAIDARFMSHVRHDWEDTVVYTVDHSWSTGEVFVYNLATDKAHSFDARNGHIEMDVDFAGERIALTGTSAHLTLVNFDGTVLAHRSNAALQRILSVEFSPSGNSLLVGSRDNTVSIFAITQ